MQDFKQITIKSYDDNAAVLADKFTQHFAGFKQQCLDSFLGLIPENGSFLDLGCGGGDAAAYAQQKGFKSLGMDLSEGMLQHAKRKGIPVIQMDIENLTFPPQSFNAIWAMTSLLHFPKQKLPNILQSLSSILEPNGFLYISLKEGTGEEWHLAKTTDNLKRFYAYWQEDEFRQLAEKHFLVRSFEKTSRKEIIFLNFVLQKEQIKNA